MIKKGKVRSKYYWFGENEKKGARQTEKPTNRDEREYRKMENKISSTMTRSHHLLTLPPFLLTPTPPNGIVFFLNPNDNNNYISSTTTHFHYYCHPFFLNQINKILSGFPLHIGHLNLSWVFGQDPSFSWSHDSCEFCPLFPLIYELIFVFWCWWDLHFLFIIGCVDLEHHQFVDIHSIRSWN